LAAPSGRGETLLDLRDIAERMGLAARGVRVGLGALALLATPAILHWDMNHFVVLERVTRMGILIMDPAAGRLQISWSEVNQSFTGVALEIKTSVHWRRRSDRLAKASLFDCIGPVGNWRNDIGVIVALSLLLEILNTAITAMEITRVLVAHRHNTSAMADRVFEVDPQSGQIVERPPE
jgi:ATP-binding cassette subfamily B protein RaxB